MKVLGLQSSKKWLLLLFIIGLLSHAANMNEDLGDEDEMVPDDLEDEDAEYEEPDESESDDDLNDDEDDEEDDEGIKMHRGKLQHNQ